MSLVTVRFLLSRAGILSTSQPTLAPHCTSNWRRRRTQTTGCFGTHHHVSNRKSYTRSLHLRFHDYYLGCPFPPKTRERRESVNTPYNHCFVLTIIRLVHQTMYQGVLRDDERRKEKMRIREEELQESMKKRAIYEQVQHVRNTHVEGLQPNS